MEVVDWSGGPTGKESIGWLGGFFAHGMRWPDYLETMGLHGDALERVEAIRRAVIRDDVRRGGDWHQTEGMPVFDDGTHAMFSMRAWGDLLAAIWSTELDTDLSYMSFYMDCTMPKRVTGRK